MECLKSLQVENLTATEGFAVFGTAVTDLQTDYCVVLSPPKTEMTGFIEGRLDISMSFTMGQLNLWFAVRSALLRWQECTLSRDEDIALLILNPLKPRLTDSTEGRGLNNFNRLWIDRCLSSLSTATFPLEEPEFETALCFGLTGVTLNRLAPLATELDGKHLYGYHCRGLIGHTVVTISQGVCLALSQATSPMHTSLVHWRLQW